MSGNEVDEFLDTLGTAGIGTVISDSSGGIIYMNDAAVSAAGLSLNEVQNESFDSIFRFIDVIRDEVLNGLSGKVLACRQAFMFPEHTVMAVTGKKWFHILGFIAPINLRNNDQYGTILNFIDDSDRYKNMESIKESEAFYRTLFETMTEGCQIIGFDWRYLYLNKAAAEHARKKKDELLGKTMLEAYPGIEGSGMFADLKECAGKRIAKDRDNLFIYPDGSRRWFHLRIRPVPEGIFILSLDIDDRKKMEQEIDRSRRYNRSLLEMMPEILIRSNSKGDYLDIVTSNEDRLVRPKNELLGKNIRDVFPLKAAERLTGHLKQTLSAGSLQKIEYSMPGGEGENWFEARTIPFENGETLSLIVDITDLKRREEKEFIEKERLMAILMSVGDGVVSTDSKGSIMFINKAAEELAGCGQEEAREKGIDELFCMYDEYTMRRMENPINEVLKTGKKHRLENHVILRAGENAEKSVEVGAAPIRDIRGNISGAVAVIRDISEKRKRLKEIEYISFHDRLTGLYNRSFYEEELRRLDTERNLPLSVIWCDIDGLKMINDTFGHSAGDEYVLKTADAIKKGCRADDIISRIGGDEFAVLLPKTGQRQAEGICERIQENVRAIRDLPLQPSVTAASDTKSEGGQKMVEIIKNAENRMLQNKMLNKKSSRSEAVSSLCRALHEMNYETEEHVKRLSRMAEKIGEALYLAPQETEELKLLAILHDIGKLGISKEIILKPGPLDQKEWVEMKRHSEIGSRIAESIPGLSHISGYILSVHERWDGNGYPRGLAGDETPKLSRVVAIIDAYDVMISGRPYKKRMAPDEAHAEILRCGGTQFDPFLVELFSKLYKSNMLALSDNAGYSII